MSSVVVVVFLAYVFLSGYLSALNDLTYKVPSYPLAIRGVTTYGDSRITQTRFARGEEITFEVSLARVRAPNQVSGNDPRVILLIVQLRGGGDSVYMAYNETNLLGSEQVVSVRYVFAGDAKPGRYDVDVLVWSDWLPGGKILVEESWRGVVYVD